MKFASVHIIYNPNSTGDSIAMSKELARTLRAALTDMPVRRIGTKYPGHARVLAHDIAKTKDRPLIVSSSGDGGYNEVVNGVMDAGVGSAICAVLPAGNANDHSSVMQHESLVDEILKQRVTHLDLIKVTATPERGDELIRYAHSYVGLGLTPVVAIELNKHTLNAFREAVLVLKTFWRHRPFKIVHRGKVLKLDSLLFANINRMAKVLTLAPENRPDDGKFEVITFKSGRKRQLIGRLAKAAVTHLDTTRRQRRYVFRTLRKMPMQLDGEVIGLPARCDVTVESAPKALWTIV